MDENQKNPDEKTLESAEKLPAQEEKQPPSDKKGSYLERSAEAAGLRVKLLAKAPKLAFSRDKGTGRSYE